jgi:hypothetical protein
MDAHWEQEQVLFRRFLGVAPQLGVLTDSIRRGYGYDLACTTTSGQELAFELTEITDGNWAANITVLQTVPDLLNTRLRDGQDADCRKLREKFRDHDIAVTLMPEVGLRRMRGALDSFFHWLSATDTAVVISSGPPEDLRRTIHRVEPRHFPGINGQCFHVTGQATWIGDGSVSAVRAKFDKDYPTGIGLQLLAYFHRQPAFPSAASGVRAYLEAVMPDEAFAVVWLYDDQNRKLLLRYP